MTPQFTPQSDIAAMHLTEDQFGDLLTAPAPTQNSVSGPAEAHLLTCQQCAAELATLRESLSLFRCASTAYADNELRSLPRVSLPSRRIFSPALEPAWLVAAAAVFLVALLPMQISRQHAFRPASTISASAANSPSESDDALLEDVDRDTSASVPAPMQALADPTTSVTTQSSAQRKD